MLTRSNSGTHIHWHKSVPCENVLKTLAQQRKHIFQHSLRETQSSLGLCLIILWCQKRMMPLFCLLPGKCLIVLNNYMSVLVEQKNSEQLHGLWSVSKEHLAIFSGLGYFATIGLADRPSSYLKFCLEVTEYFDLLNCPVTIAVSMNIHIWFLLVFLAHLSKLSAATRMSSLPV